MRYLPLLLIVMFLSSCNDLFDNSNRKATQSAKKYTEDYFFSKNQGVEFVEFKLTKLESISNDLKDSLIRKFKKNELLKIALKLSGQDVQNPDFSAPGFIENIEDAKRSRDYQLYSSRLDSYLGQPGYIAHIYSKYRVSKDGSIDNKLHNDRQYLLSTDFVTLGVIQ